MTDQRRGGPAPEVPAHSELTIAQKIRKLRQLWRLSVSDLAKLAGLTEAVVFSAEGGKREPSLETLQALGRVFDLDLTDWNRPFSFEEVIGADQLVCSDLLKYADYADSRFARMAPDNPHAHGSMLRDQKYLYVRGEDVSEQTCRGRLSRPGSKVPISPDWGPLGLKKGPVMVYLGGALQHILFRSLVDRLDDMVLDKHDGEELMVVVEGCVDLVIQARDQPGDKRLFRGEPAVKRVRVERPEPGASTKVNCEVFHLEPGTPYKYTAEWNHGYMLNPDWVTREVFLLRGEDLKQPKVLLRRLKAAEDTDTGSQLLSSYLSTDTRQQLAAYDGRGAPWKALIQGVVDDLNHAMEQSDLFTEGSVEGLDDEKIQQLRRSVPTIEFNRQILQSCIYPGHIAEILKREAERDHSTGRWKRPGVDVDGEPRPDRFPKMAAVFATFGSYLAPGADAGDSTEWDEDAVVGDS